MQTSKKHLLHFLLSLNLLSLAACNLPSPKDKNSESKEDTVAATFSIETVKGNSSAEQTAGTFALPESKVFNFSVCVKDIAYNKTIQGGKFEIEETGKDIVSDSAGCLNWSETVKYNFLGDSQYIELERTVKAKGLHKGTRTVKLAINPWSHGETLPAVVDLKKEEVTKLVSEEKASEAALKGLSADNQTRTRSLWVEDGRMFVTEQKLTTDGAVLMLEMRATPSILLTKMNGELVQRPLTAGTFKARLKLIHVYNESNKEIHRLLTQTEMIDTKMENGSLAIKAPASLPAMPTRGQIILGLELSPVGAPEGLTSFDGIYLLGEYDQIKGSNFLKLATQVAQTKGFKIADYINAQMTALMKNQDGAVDSETYQKPKIEVSQLEFRYIRVGEETTSTREVFYNIKACVKNGIDQKNTRSQTFTVTKFRQNEGDSAQTVNVKTDNNSCITWDESIKFQYFDCQRYLKGYVQINNNELGMNEKLAIIVNPWESWGAVARDMRYVDASEKIILDCRAENRPKTQVMMDYFSYATLSYNYQVDHLMNLVVTKKIQFKMDPKLLIYSSLANGRAEAQKLRDGIYLLKLAVVRNADYDSNRTYVASAEKLITVISGQVNTDITFQTSDLKALGSRNNLLVEIYPVDEKKVINQDNQLTLKDAKASLDSAIDLSTGLETPTFIGPITLNADETTRPLRMADLSAVNTYLLAGQGQNNSDAKNVVSKVIAQGKKDLAVSYAAQKAHSDLRTFAKENNLDIVSLKTAKDKSPLAALYPQTVNRVEKLVLNKSDLQGIISAGKIQPETAQKLCAFWAQDYLTQMYKAKGGAIQKDMVLTLGHDCYVAVKADPTRFFQLENQMLIKEVGGSRYLKGYNQGLSVGTSFSMSRAHSTYTTVSQSIAAKVGFGKKFLDLFSIGADYAATISWATSDANSASNSVSVNGSTTMTVQQSVLKVRINKYEQCAIVRMNPALFIKNKKSWYNITRQDYVDALNTNLSGDEMAAAAGRGLLLCEGEVRTKPVDVTENYYMLAQESNSSQMQDNGDDRNRNFFLALRSTNDYNRFVTAIKGKTAMPNSAKSEADLQTDATDTMIKLFDLGSPTIPGTFRN